MKYVTSIERNASKKSLTKGISLGLRLKFGDRGQDLLPEIEVIDDIDTLERILEAIEKTATIDELRQYF
jgi:hypothetical protein